MSSSVSSIRSAPVLAGARQLLADYFELTKPKVQTLLLFTTIATMEIAGSPPVSTIGSFILAFGVVLTVINVAMNYKRGALAGPDPWKGNTLEWFVPSPPPVNNFDAIPRVRSVEPMRDIRRQVERSTGVTQKTGGSERFTRV